MSLPDRTSATRRRRGPRGSSGSAQTSTTIAPPDGYPQLKRRFLASIHPGFEALLEGYEDISRIEPFEIEWGGVAPDGIPPLENPPNIPAEEADYLESHERVFGVSINGEHRAYPLRIMNPA